MPNFNAHVKNIFMTNPQKEMAALLYVYFENNDKVFTPYDLLPSMSIEILKLEKLTHEGLARFIADQNNMDIDKVHFPGSDFLFDTIIEKFEQIRSGQ